jgi:2-polyprenyl-3-methyl-5-hydroxy-6-metoxy-1,4-benzoquinol methylase
MPSVGSKASCPLCGGRPTTRFWEDRQRAYRRCPHCRLVFVPRQYWLDAKKERAVYDLHQNDPADPGYRRFLSRLTVPLMERLDPGSRGLDFGCGPGPALPLMLAEHGHLVDRYDPFFFDDRSVLDKRYDFICATEVVEHLHEPDRDLATLFTLLKPGGWLGIMTKLVIDRDAFSRWHYIRDPTHVCFFSRETFAYLARHFSATCEWVDNDVILMRTPR